MEGGVAEQLAGGNGASSNRPIWILQHQGSGDPLPAMNVVLDMATGEVLEIRHFGTEAEGGDELPMRVDIHPNYPNPFNPSTTIPFDLPRAGKVSLVVYDVSGREVATLIDRWEPAGGHATRWNAGGLASGLYLARLVPGRTTPVLPMVLQK